MLQPKKPIGHAPDHPKASVKECNNKQGPGLRSQGRRSGVTFQSWCGGGARCPNQAMRPREWACGRNGCCSAFGLRRTVTTETPHRKSELYKDPSFLLFSSLSYYFVLTTANRSVRGQVNVFPGIHAVEDEINYIFFVTSRISYVHTRKQHYVRHLVQNIVQMSVFQRHAVCSSVGRH